MSTSHLHDDRFVTWVTGRNTAVALACWVAVALVAGCGAQSSTVDSAKSDSAVEATEAAQSTPSEDSTGKAAQGTGIEEAGAGESQSMEGGLGSREYGSPDMDVGHAA